MITFKEFIEEISYDNNKSAMKLLNLMKKIGENSKPYINAIGGPNSKKLKLFMYKGFRSRQNTKLLETPNSKNEKINPLITDFFKNKFGINYEKSISVSHDPKNSSIKKDGVPIVIIPKGNFKFAYSNSVNNLSSILPTINSTENINEKLDFLKYKNDDIINALKSKREIIIDVDSYYVFNSMGKDFKNTEEIITFLSGLSKKNKEIFRFLRYEKDPLFNDETVSEILERLLRNGEL